MRINRHSQTYEDIVEIAAYLGREDPAIADRFYDSYEDTLKSLRRTPKLGSTRTSENYGKVRMWYVRDFERILILYKERPDEVVILRVIHSARDYTKFI